MIATVNIPNDNQPEDRMSTPKGDENNRLLTVVKNEVNYNGSAVSAKSSGEYIPRTKMSNASSALNDEKLL